MMNAGIEDVRRHVGAGRGRLLCESLTKSARSVVARLLEHERPQRLLGLGSIAWLPSILWAM